ncbi:MAG: hypothetical protein VZR54_09300 [Ruminococcus sp.]|nr:hypothetical protein [Ruminococcus sp.]
MTYDDFLSIEDETERRNIFQAMDDAGVLYDDMEAERNSFKEENEKLRDELKEVKAEMKKTKEMNFTLARTVDRSGAAAQSAEDILHDMFK